MKFKINKVPIVKSKKIKTNKFLTITYKGKGLNPKWVDFKNSDNGGFMELNPPKKYAMVDKSISVRLPGFSFGNLLINLFMLCLPFVLVLMLYSDSNYDFDFFYALEQFSKIQPSNTIDCLNDMKEIANKMDFLQTFTIYDEGAKDMNGLELLYHNITNGLKYFGYLGINVLNFFRLIFVLLWDTIANVIAMVSFLFNL